MPGPFFCRRFSRLIPIRLLSTAQTAQRFRPYVETLEDRIALATYQVLTTGNATGAVTNVGVGQFTAPTLRAAVDAANTSGGTNTITFAPAIAGQTITLTSNDTFSPFAFGPTELVIGKASPAKTDNLTIQGDANLGITINGGGTRRIFGILGGSTLTLQNSTITGGAVQGGHGGDTFVYYGEGGGGGAGMGGAVFLASGGTLNIFQSTLTGNTATGGRGGNGSGSGTGARRSGGGGGGSAAYNGGNFYGLAFSGAGGGGGGVRGPGQPDNSGGSGAGGLNEFGGSTSYSGGYGYRGGGGAGGYGQFNGYNRGGSGYSVSSGGFGGGGGGAFGGCCGSGPYGGGRGGFGAGGGGGRFQGGSGGFGGGAGAAGNGYGGSPGFGGGSAPAYYTYANVGGGGGAGLGGAIFNNGGSVTITDSTLTGNTATGGAGGQGGYGNGGGGQGLGGAIFNRNGSVTILNSTIAFNTATNGGAGVGSGSGGGIYNLSDGNAAATLNLANSIVSGSTAANNLVNNRFRAYYSGSKATINATTPNIVQNNITTLNGATTNTSGSLNTANPQLAPALANNGGPTKTLALTASSTNAIDKGTNNPGGVFGTLPTTDQRGFNRIVNTAVDIGAYEFQTSPAPTTIALVSSSNPSLVGQPVTFTATVTGTVPGSNTPVGSITFVIDGASVGTFPLVNGVATYTAPSLSAGSHTVTANYGGGTRGDIVFAASTKSFNQVVGFSPTITSAASTTFFLGSPSSFTITTNGIPAPAITIAGALPPGVTLVDNGDGTATLAGIPAGFQAGVFQFVITATNPFAPPAIQTFTLNLVRPPTIPVFITGAGPGLLPEVKVYSAATGVLQADFLAFDASFTGGVRVALGDVNNDGILDYICGAGPGGGPQVFVLDGRTGKALMNFFAFSAAQTTPSGTATGGNSLQTFTFHGGVNVAAGDVNGDGYADIIVGADAGGGPQVVVFDGKTGALLSSFFAFAPSFTGGVRVAAGDVNGDGRADVITAAGKGGGPQVTVFDYTGQTVLRSFFAFAPNFTGGVYVAGGDVNGDLITDIICGAGAGGGPQVTTYDGTTLTMLSSFFAYPASFTGGVRVGATDYNRDGKADILTAAGQGGGPQIEAFDNSTLALLSSFFAYDPKFTGGTFVSG